MQVASEETVLGNFNDVRFEHFGVETSFRREGDKFLVKTPNSEGVPTEYQIDYTFGLDPLQQYLIAFPGGRYQALRSAGTRARSEEGGQRWFHLYPDEEIPPDDVLHWTRAVLQLELHVRRLPLDRPEEELRLRQPNSYATTWSEINVSCEACHGPALRPPRLGGGTGSRRGEIPRIRHGLVGRRSRTGEVRRLDGRPGDLQP